jgi:hypothetical protein
MEKVEDSQEYMKGMKACQKGEECPIGAHPDFERGYSCQYEKDQVADWLSERGAA